MGATPATAPTARHLPRWRGFNLLEKFTKRSGGNPPYQESDFALMAEWGFDFARLPMSYLCWAEPGDWLKFREPELKHIDAAVELEGAPQRVGSTSFPREIVILRPQDEYELHIHFVTTNLNAPLHKTSLFVTSGGYTGFLVPGIPWPGPALVKIPAGVPGLPLP